TREEITDIINDALEPQKLSLITFHKTFFLQPTNEPIDVQYPRKELADLAKLPKREIARVVIPLAQLKPYEIAPIAKRWLSGYGTLADSDDGKALVVQDTADNLREIVKLLRAADEKAAERPVVQKTYLVNFKEAKWDDVFDWYAKISGL